MTERRDCVHLVRYDSSQLVVEPNVDLAAPAAHLRESDVRAIRGRILQPRNGERRIGAADRLGSVRAGHELTIGARRRPRVRSTHHDDPIGSDDFELAGAGDLHHVSDDVVQRDDLLRG